MAEVDTEDDQLKHSMLLSENVTQGNVSSEQLKTIIGEQLQQMYPLVIWALVNLLLVFCLFLNVGCCHETGDVETSPAVKAQPTFIPGLELCLMHKPGELRTCQ